RTKIESLVSLEEKSRPNLTEEPDSLSNRAVVHRFRKVFALSEDEKLVNYYTCCYWRGSTPCRGKLYLSVNFLCFDSFLMGKQTKIKLKWSDITKLEKNPRLLLPQSITVTTREDTYSFSMFINFEETFKLCTQLATIGVKQLYDEIPFAEDVELKEKHANDLKKKSNSFVKRDLDARYRSESFRFVSTLTLNSLREKRKL
uniref:GRAM domain-containing protein n=2 Tax=Plectus sambesii TaxID=2011161 RepID=A0A914VZZ4_9BILA